MPRLKLGPVPDDRPVRLTVMLPAATHRKLEAYARALAEETGQMTEPAKLVAPMLDRFMASDRGFARATSRRAAPAEQAGSGSAPQATDL